MHSKDILNALKYKSHDSWYAGMAYALSSMLLAFFLSISIPNKTPVKVEVYSPTLPVLVGKAENPVLRINVIRSQDNQILNIEALKLSFLGTSDLKDIDQISIFYTGKSIDFSTAELIATNTALDSIITFVKQQKIAPGANYFWLSLRLDVKTDLAHQIGLQCKEVTVDGKSISVNNPRSPALKRIGIALRKHNDDGVHTYRIPGLITTNKGTLIGVYDLRYNSSVDLQEDIDIGMSRSTDGGQSWEPMKVIMDMGGWGGKPEIQNGIGDPAILVDRQTNTIWVAGIWAHGHPGKRNWNASKPGLLPAETSQLMLTKSEDDGLTWTEPINITSMVKKPEWHLLLQGPGKGITMIDGTLVFAAQYKDKNQIPHSTILYSKDQGKTWQLGTGAKSKTTESQVVELKDGSLMLNMRDDRGRDPVGNGYRSVAITSDLGKTWIEHPSSRKSLIEPVCNASLIKHVYTINGDVNEILLFVNPADQYKRKNMTIKVSFDEGRTWPASYHTLIDAGTGRGYPSLTSIDQNTIGILYEGSQADLVFQKFSLTQLLSKD